MPDYRQTVFTIHGISTDGPWQKAVRNVLEPHFRCIPLPYSQFRRLGGLKILFGSLFRTSAVKNVAGRFSTEAVSVALAPHAIAHSFGTRILTEIMRLPFVNLDRVVFAGSPLREDFAWETLLQQNPSAFRDLRNETGERDWVIQLAGFIGKVHPGLGSAGWRGFKTKGVLVHDLTGPDLSCKKCRDLVAAGKQPARIHNVSWSNYRHSGWFVSDGHTANLWLPFFWGIEPKEYASFVEKCLDAARRQTRKEWSNLERTESELRASTWSWTRQGDKESTLLEYVEREAAAYYRHRGFAADKAALDQVKDFAAQSIWDAVHQAVEERRKPHAERKEAVVVLLHPPTAVGAVVKVLCESRMERQHGK